MEEAGVERGFLLEAYKIFFMIHTDVDSARDIEILLVLYLKCVSDRGAHLLLCQGERVHVAKRCRPGEGMAIDKGSTMGGAIGQLRKHERCHSMAEWQGCVVQAITHGRHGAVAAHLPFNT